MLWLLSPFLGFLVLFTVLNELVILSSDISNGAMEFCFGVNNSGCGWTNK